MGSVYTMLVKIGSQLFKVLNCQKAASVKEGFGELHEAGIKELFKPLAFEDCSEEFIQIIELDAKTFVSGLFDLPDGQERGIKFKTSSGQEYTALFQMVRSSEIFGFLLLPISDDEFRKLDKTAIRKRYIMGYSPDHD